MDIILSVVAFALLFSATIAQVPNFYTAAVVDYAQTYNITNGDPKKLMLYNVEVYKNYTRDAKKQGANIIVFPEYGLTGTDVPSTAVQLEKYSSVLPKVNTVPTNPCTDERLGKLTSEVVRNLSCIAREMKIYIVVNLPEMEEGNGSEIRIYNTDVVFDRNGGVVARYRKYNLFDEPGYSKPKVPEQVTFQTDFGVTFGIFTCFDILFDSPARRLVYDKNVTNLIFPTAWMSELPFLTAVQTQAGWSRTHGVNLLAANYRFISKDFGGSGVYMPKSNTFTPIVPNTPNTEMIVVKVNKTINRSYLDNFIDNTESRDYSATFNPTTPGLHTRTEELSNYSHKPLNGQNITNLSIQNGNFTCTFKVRCSKLDKASYKYKLVAYQGKRYMGSTQAPVQACGIITCLNNSITSCGIIDYKPTTSPIFPQFNEIEVSGSFANHQNSLVFPSTVTYQLNSLPYNSYSYDRKGEKASIKLKTVATNLLTFGIYANTNPMNSGTGISCSNVLFITLILLTFFKLN